jgi:hypothetical protein
MADTVRMDSRDNTKRRRRVVVLLGVLATLVVAVLLLTLGHSAAVNYADSKIVEQARQHGIIVHLTTTSVSASGVHLGKGRLELEGVNDVSATFDSADVTLQGLTPTKLAMLGLHLQAIGDPLVLKRSVDAWRAKYDKPSEPNALPRPELHNTQFTWSQAPQTPAFVHIDGLEFSQNAADARLWSVTGSRAQVGAYYLEPLAVALQVEPNAVEVGLGATQLAAAVVRGGWRRETGSDDLHLQFGAIPIGALLERLGLHSSDHRLAAANCGGAISLRVPDDAQLPYTGAVKLDLIGWIPPHPPELDGFAFGNTTTIASTFELDRTLSNANLRALEITAGEFKLRGQALVQIAALAYAQVQAKLSGQIPCSALASAVGESKLGKSYGQWMAQHAGRAVEGHVDVAVVLEADSRHADQAKIYKQVGVGCGVRPLTLREALSLGLPPLPDADFIKHAAKGLPKFEVKLPDVPKLPPVPTINWPSSKKQ